MSIYSLVGFAEELLRVESRLERAEDRAIVKACEILQARSKGVIGEPQPWWPPLAPSTIAHKGADTPLLETGELRASIEMTAPIREGDEVKGYVGSNEDKAVWQELGTSRIPPRSFLAVPAMQATPEIVAEIDAEVVMALKIP